VITFIIDLFAPVRTVDQLVRRERNIFNCAFWIESQISYTKVLDKRQTPEETLKTRTGDCVAMSNLFAECLLRFGFRPYLLELEMKHGKHQICAWEAGSWYYFSNGVIHKLPRKVKDLKGVAYAYEPNLIRWRECDAEGYNV